MYLDPEKSVIVFHLVELVSEFITCLLCAKKTSCILKLNKIKFGYSQTRQIVRGKTLHLTATLPYYQR